MIPTIEERANKVKRLCLHYGIQRLDLDLFGATGCSGVAFWATCGWWWSQRNPYFLQSVE